MLDTKKLLLGCDICYKNICTLHPPTLRTIFSNYDLFVKSVTMLILKKQQFVDMVQLNEIINPKEYENMSVYQLIILFPQTREMLQEALSFFVAEKLTFDEQNLRFHIEENDKYIDDDNFSEIVSSICNMCCVSYDNEDTKALKFASKKAQEVYEKCQRGRQQSKKFESKSTKKDETSLEQMVSFLSTNRGSYNLINIWDLTLYQFYSEFYWTRYNKEFESSQHRWEVWGDKEFDFTLAYKGFDFSKI